MSLSFLYFGIYSLFLVVIWGFFIIIRIHSIKFKNFQTNIITGLRVLCIILIVLSLFGYISLYMITSGKNVSNIKKIDNTNNSYDISKTINSMQEEIY